VAAAAVEVLQGLLLAVAAEVVAEEIN